MSPQTLSLWRPVGLREMELILEADRRAFPPRLEWQPYFYPVLNRGYAEQIARDWNARDKASGFIGVVTAFEAEAAYAEKFEARVVGGREHRELWVPAEELAEFNRRLAGPIRFVAAFPGPDYAGPPVALDAETTA